MTKQPKRKAIFWLYQNYRNAVVIAEDRDDAIGRLAIERHENWHNADIHLLEWTRANRTSRVVCSEGDPSKGNSNEK